MSNLESQLLKPKLIEAGKFGQATLKHWAPDMALSIYESLEMHNWAPWLAASEQSIAGRANVFPEGQLLIESPTGEPVASVSTNRINWDEHIDNLPSWDTVAGDPTTYENTYVPNGNTLVLMSMNVHPQYKKHGLATTLVHQVQELTTQLGVAYVVGSFRPSEFGIHKAIYGVIPFEDYVFKTRGEDNFPVDAWIRSLTKNGMLPLKVDTKAMTVSVDLASFDELKMHYHPELWHQVAAGIWECGEVGQWNVNVNEGYAVYQESNLWGILPGTTNYDKFK